MYSVIWETIQFKIYRANINFSSNFHQYPFHYKLPWNSFVRISKNCRNKFSRNTAVNPDRGVLRFPDLLEVCSHGAVECEKRQNNKLRFDYSGVLWHKPVRQMREKTAHVSDAVREFYFSVRHGKLLFVTTFYYDRRGISEFPAGGNI